MNLSTAQINRSFSYLLKKSGKQHRRVEIKSPGGEKDRALVILKGYVCSSLALRGLNKTANLLSNDIRKLRVEIGRYFAIML